MTIVPEITSVDGVARHSQIIRLPAPPSLLVDNTCRRAGTKQLGVRGDAQGIRWYGGLRGQNSARGKFRTSPRKVRGKFRTKLKYRIFPAEFPPPPPVGCKAFWFEIMSFAVLAVYKWVFFAISTRQSRRCSLVLSLKNLLRAYVGHIRAQAHIHTSGLIRVPVMICCTHGPSVGVGICDLRARSSPFCERGMPSCREPRPLGQAQTCIGHRGGALGSGG